MIVCWDLWSRVPFSSDMSLLASSGFATYADSRRLSALLCCVGVCVPLPSSLSVFILQHQGRQYWVPTSLGLLYHLVKLTFKHSVTASQGLAWELPFLLCAIVYAVSFVCFVLSHCRDARNGEWTGDDIPVLSTQTQTFLWKETWFSRGFVLFWAVLDLQSLQLYLLPLLN